MSKLMNANMNTNMNTNTNINTNMDVDIDLDDCSLDNLNNLNDNQVTNLKKMIKNLKLRSTIKKFQNLHLSFDKSPSDKYFIKYFNKIYNETCLKITCELLNKINKLSNINPCENKLITTNNIIDNVKTFLYAYIIVSNHHEIFGKNSTAEKNLIKSSLDMLYIFIKLCDKIYKNKLVKVEYLLKRFVEKYNYYYQNYLLWKKQDAKELLDVLTYSYYNLSRNLHNIDTETDYKNYKIINDQIDSVENKIQYLLLDNSPNKAKVKQYVCDNMSQNKIMDISQKVDKNFWEIQIYNLENKINIKDSLIKLIEIIKKKFERLSNKYSYSDLNWNDGPVPIYLNYIKNKELDFEIFSNKYFLNVIYYLFQKTEDIENKISELNIKKDVSKKAKLNKKTRKSNGIKKISKQIKKNLLGGSNINKSYDYESHNSNDDNSVDNSVDKDSLQNPFQDKINKQYCLQRYTDFSINFLHNDFSQIVPQTLKNILENLYQL